MTTPAKAQPSSALATLKDQLAKARDRLAEVAPKYLNVDRVTRLLLAACGRNPKILQCTPESILQFAMKCAETGLEPIGAGGCWPIPYENKKAGTVELQFIPDYRGLGNSAKHAGCITDYYAEVVRAGDEFDYELGISPKLYHKPARKDRGALEAGYCILVLPGGEKRFVVMDGEAILAIKRRSRAANSGPWVTDEAEMWKKTVVRRAMKPFVGMSPALDSAIEAYDAAEDVRLASEPVQMPKAFGEVAGDNGNGKHEEAPDTIPQTDVDNQAAEAEAAERTARANQLLADIPLARKTWDLQVAKHWGGRKWDALTADEQEKELTRLAGMKPVEA